MGCDGIAWPYLVGTCAKLSRFRNFTENIFTRSIRPGRSDVDSETLLAVLPAISASVRQTFVGCAMPQLYGVCLLHLVRACLTLKNVQRRTTTALVPNITLRDAVVKPRKCSPLLKPFDANLVRCGYVKFLTNNPKHVPSLNTGTVGGTSPSRELHHPCR